MSFTIIFLIGTIFTINDWTPERFFASMNANVILHIGVSCHHFRADWTNIFVMAKFDGFSILKQMEEFQNTELFTHIIKNNLKCKLLSITNEILGAYILI